VSRGELVEIGGSFRVPEVMEKSGARLREVGSTNRTHPEDYERAIDETTALLLKVHTSNYRIVGFSSQVDLASLVEIGRRRGIPVMEDLGSGALVDLSLHGLPKEPVVAERIACGADVVTFSGDKVLGGPQAGLIVGRRELVDRISRNPMHRALRCGKLTIAALEATLRLYLESPDVAREIPALAAVARPIAELEHVGLAALALLSQALGDDHQLSLEDSTSQVGSGALPTDEIRTKVIAVRGATASASEIAARFRAARPPILGRIKDDTFLLDLRTITDPEDLLPDFGSSEPSSAGPQGT
jgi:L-seryl-tRNA(Ser) seleniumtransferase